MEFYRIKIGSYITYSENQYSENNAKVLDYNNIPKTFKRNTINFIRRNYEGICIRDIINGTYKAILENGFLIGVQFDMNKLKK